LRHAGGTHTSIGSARPGPGPAQGGPRAADAVGVGPTDDEAALLPLDRSQLDALREHVEALLGTGGCDQTHRATDSWAARHGIALDRLHEGLEEYGGFCDCEVVMNVDPAVVFAPGRQAAAGPSVR